MDLVETIWSGRTEFHQMVTGFILICRTIRFSRTVHSQPHNKTNRVLIARFARAAVTTSRRHASVRSAVGFIFAVDVILHAKVHVAIFSITTNTVGDPQRYGLLKEICGSVWRGIAGKGFGQVD